MSPVVSEVCPVPPQINLLARERATLERYLPGLVGYLHKRPLLELEGAESGAIAAFREAGGPTLLAPVEMGGCGARALDAVRVQRALGAASPSLAAATTMHHLSLATLLEHCRQATDEEVQLVEGLMHEHALLASGFSEGRPGGSVFEPTMEAVQRGDEYVITGSKKPCSLSKSMDLLIATIAVEENDRFRRGIALIPARTPGITRREFWESWVLAGAESDEVVLDGVVVPAELVLFNDTDDPDGQHEMTGFLWFGLMISTTYLGAASSLLEKFLRSGKEKGEAYTRAAADLEAGMAAIEGVAMALDAGERGQDISARMLFVRQSIQKGLIRSTEAIIEALGGMSFVGSSEIAYLAAVVHALGFHPPSRRSMAGALSAYHAGYDLTFV